MEHPNATAARRALDAFAHGDPGPTDALLDDDLVVINHDLADPWHRLEGKAQVLAFFQQFEQFLEGTFAQAVVDALATDDHLVLLVHETGHKDGAVYDNHALYLVELRDGRWTRMETFDRDREAGVRFFEAVGAPDAALNSV